MASGISLNSITLRIDDAVLIDDLSLNVKPGSCGVIMGPSGCGKSSLINHICGTLDAPFAITGEIYLDNLCLDTIPVERRGLGILFQDDLLFPHFSVGENIALAFPQHFSRQHRGVALREILASVDLSNFEDRDPLTLSSGQRVRVSLARCLSAQPKAILLDEPFAKLHQNLRRDIRSLIFGLCQTRHIPCLLVTHDIEDANAVLARMTDSFVIDLAKQK